MPGQGGDVPPRVRPAPARGDRPCPLQFVLVAHIREGGGRCRLLRPASPQVEFEPPPAVATALERTDQHPRGLVLVQVAVRGQALDRTVDLLLRIVAASELRPQLGREVHAPREQVQPPVVGRLGTSLSFRFRLAHPVLQRFGD